MNRKRLREIIREEVQKLKLQKDLYEELASLEHEQWMDWAKNIAETEKITPERLKRWKEDLFVPYEELPEEEKKKDRVWVNKVLKIIARETGREEL